jgi:anti-sigma-K factor RskA
MDCQEFQELSGAYALGATSQEERREAEEHLSQCATCLEVLQELQKAVDYLPFAVPPIEPSASVKTRLFATIQAEAGQHARNAQMRPLMQRQTRPGWWSYWQTRVLATVAAIFLLLCGGMAMWNMVLQQQLAAVPSFTTTIQGTNQMGSVQGVVLYLPQTRTTTVMVHGLPALTGTTIYQGWLIKNNQPQSIGRFDVRDGTAILSFPGDSDTYDAIAISREPGPQASPDRPHGTVVATGSLPRVQQRVGWRDNIYILGDLKVSHL